jgi:predicted homoserine dehydrogenase-like protein
MVMKNTDGMKVGVRGGGRLGAELWNDVNKVRTKEIIGVSEMNGRGGGYGT